MGWAISIWKKYVYGTEQEHCNKCMCTPYNSTEPAATMLVHQS